MSRNFNPHRISNAERLAFRLSNDKKVRYVNIKRHTEKRTFCSPLIAILSSDNTFKKKILQEVNRRLLNVKPGERICINIPHHAIDTLEFYSLEQSVSKEYIGDIPTKIISVE